MKNIKVEVEEYAGFRIGDRFVITSEPKFWSSSLNDNPPIGRVTYPYYGTIKRILIHNDDLVAMTEGKYGWSLDSLLKDDKIQSIRMLRKKKLKKIKNL